MIPAKYVCIVYGANDIQHAVCDDRGARVEIQIETCFLENRLGDRYAKQQVRLGFGTEVQRHQCAHQLTVAESMHWIFELRNSNNRI